jgi:hypothetical protein
MITKNYLFIAQVVDQAAQEVMLLVANSHEKVYDFKSVETNIKRYREHSYTFLDSTEGSVFLHINHYGDYSKYGHVYISDGLGINYSLSLKYNVRGDGGQCDFEKVNSLEGLYIANVLDPDYMKDHAQEIEEQEFQEEVGMEERKLKRAEAHNAFMEYITTVISFNKGGSWHRLKAPDRDSTGKKYECEDNNCYLNFFGVSSAIAPFYSVDSAAGIIIANGTVGKYLSKETTDINTFLTRDGGLTWFEIRKGAHIYEIGDHGALIVIADNHNPTDRIHYSWDEGLSFQELVIANEPMMVENVIIEPSSTGQHFVVYGNRMKKGKKMGVVIGIDFSSLHEPQCKNPENPDATDSDYEKWTPNDGRAGKECLLGRKVIYVRRKREAQCYNGLDFERKTFIENCQCVEDDFECDVGYHRPAEGEPCSRIDPTTEHEIQKPPEQCNHYYRISKGYRRIPGDTCTNGLAYDPIIVPCPYSGIHALIGNASFGLFLLICVILVYYGITGNYFKGIGDTLRIQRQTNSNIPDYVNIVIKSLIV